MIEEIWVFFYDMGWINHTPQFEVLRIQQLISNPVKPDIQNYSKKKLCIRLLNLYTLQKKVFKERFYIAYNIWYISVLWLI